jgi:AcrR family transcriptional regulator
VGRPREFDEDQVLRSVRDQFWDCGYAATSLQDLVRVSGLGKGSLYAAFGDKHQLFVRTLRGYTEESHHHLRRLLNDTPRALDALRVFLLAPVGDEDADAARRGCLMANSTCELAAADPDVLAEARRTYETTTALVAECVTRAKYQGDLPADADAVGTARALLAAQQGLVFMGRTGMDISTLAGIGESLASRLLPAPE